MSLSLALVILLAHQSISAEKYDVAYVAKYYGASAKTSYYQVYLCDHEGKVRICVTNNAKNYSSVRWVNNSDIAMIEQGPQYDTLQIYSLKTLQSSTIKSFGKAEKPVLLTHPYVGINVCLLRTGDTPYRYYSVERSGLKPIPNPPATAFRYLDGQMNFYAHGQLVSVSQTKGNEPDSITWTFTKESGSAILASGPTTGYFEAFQPSAKSQLWVNLWAGDDRVGYRSDLYLLDFSKGTAKTIISNVHNLSFHFDSRYWSATSPYYQYKTLGDGTKVRVNSGIIGDRTTRSRWTISTGACHVRSISLMPGM
jgi:hypothetical protein